VIRLVVIAALLASCQVNDYCIDCVPFDGGGNHAGDGGDAGDLFDASGDAACVPTGAEVCDGEDNDCSGLVDDGLLPGVGVACSNQLGECAGGLVQCVNGALQCNKQPAPDLSRPARLALFHSQITSRRVPVTECLACRRASAMVLR
jgi:hypothetical protein